MRDGGGVGVGDVGADVDERTGMADGVGGYYDGAAGGRSDRM